MDSAVGGGHGGGQGAGNDLDDIRVAGAQSASDHSTRAGELPGVLARGNASGRGEGDGASGNDLGGDSEIA